MHDDAFPSAIDAVRDDLYRRHRFAAERVGFLACRAARLANNGLIILATEYHPVADDDYVEDPTVGAMMGARAIRVAMQLAYNGGREDTSVFHIHMHDRAGYPVFSQTDLTESGLGRRLLLASTWTQTCGNQPIFHSGCATTILGMELMDPRLVSQSFLGPDSDAILAQAEVGVAGLCGGGSHVVQQLAHVGVGNFVVVDDDIIEEKNLNRLVGGTRADVDAKFSKVSIAERVIRSVNPAARVIPRSSRWQDAIEDLRRCDVIFGCLDSYRERDELERFCRRYLIPYIDCGMDVHGTSGTFSISGQVVLSSPGGPCLWCFGILTKGRIAEEAGQYGKAGSRPQVVWSNGVLASIAVDLFVQLICPWHGRAQMTACCEFDGNRHRIETSRLDNLAGSRCSHFRPDEVGDAFFVTSTNVGA
jgi:hypothetical protein